MISAPRAISSAPPAPRGPSERAPVSWLCRSAPRYPSPPRDDMAYLPQAMAIGARWQPHGGVGRNRHADRSRAISLVAYGLSSPPREPASLAAR